MCGCGGTEAQRDRGSEQRPRGKEDVGGPGPQPERCPRQQKPEAEEARVALVPLPSSLLVFPKTQGENNSLLKSTNLLVPSWGSLPHPTQANKAAVSSRSPGNGQPAPAAPPAPARQLRGSSGRPNPVPGTETCPQRQNPLSLERGNAARGRLGLSQSMWEQVCACAGEFLQLKPNAAQTDSRVSSRSIFCGEDLCRERRLRVFSVLSEELAWGGTVAGDGSRTSCTLC